MQILQITHSNPESSYASRFVFAGGYSMMIVNVLQDIGDHDYQRALVEYASIEPKDKTASRQEFGQFLAHLERTLPPGIKICIPKEGLPDALTNAAIDEWYDQEDWEYEDFLTRVTV